MKIENSVVLVTGGNRGLGAALVREALSRGARKVYAAARDPRAVTIPGAVPLQLDITDKASVAAAAEEAGDVTILINNAAIYVGADLLTGDLDDLHRELETNLLGPLHVTRAFAPALTAAGAAHIVNIHSVLSWFAMGGSYAVSKAALWHATNLLRLDLAPHGVGVTGLHVGLMDTDMAATLTEPKISPVDVAAQAFDAIAVDAHEVLADDMTRNVKQALSADPSALYPQLAKA